MTLLRDSFQEVSNELLRILEILFIHGVSKLSCIVHLCVVSYMYDVYNLALYKLPVFSLTFRFPLGAT